MATVSSIRLESSRHCSTSRMPARPAAIPVCGKRNASRMPARCAPVAATSNGTAAAAASAGAKAAATNGSNAAAAAGPPMTMSEYLNMRHKAVLRYFPNALGADDFVARVEVALGGYGFTPANSIGARGQHRRR